MSLETRTQTAHHGNRSGPNRRRSRRAYKDIQKAIEVYSCKPTGGIAKIDNLIEEFFEEDKWLLKLSSRNSEGNLKITDDLI